MGFEAELWVEYGIGTLTFLLRFFARWKVVGVRGFAWDDFFALIAMIMWTADTVNVYIIDKKGSFVGLNEVSANELTDAQVHDLTIGSKTLFATWITYITLIWSLKASLLFFYSRLTLQLAQKTLVKIMGYICAVSYIATLLVLFLHCTPIQKNWQIKPYAGDKCTLTVLNYIFVATVSVFTDAGILAIPIPLIYSVRIPIYRKIFIALLLCSGIFIMTAALLRCILSLKTNGEINNSTIWGIRETFVCVLAVSAPAIRPIFSKSRWISSPDPNPIDHNPLDPGPFGNNPTWTGKYHKFCEGARRGGVELLSVEGDGTFAGFNPSSKASESTRDLERGESFHIEMQSERTAQSDIHLSAAGIDLSRKQSQEPIWTHNIAPGFMNEDITNHHVTSTNVTSTLVARMESGYLEPDGGTKTLRWSDSRRSVTESCDGERRIHGTTMKGRRQLEIERPPYILRSYSGI